jgi:hypothetical protein
MPTLVLDLPACNVLVPAAYYVVRTRIYYVRMYCSVLLYSIPRTPELRQLVVCSGGATSQPSRITARTPKESQGGVEGHPLK